MSLFHACSDILVLILNFSGKFGMNVIFYLYAIPALV